MAEQSMSALSELLNEEKWTRATINNYTVQNFKELDGIIESIISNEQEDEVRDQAEEHLKHTKNSIIALYISGILALRKQLVDDTNILNLVNIFTDNHKWKIVEYLCNRILQFGENKVALRILAECYEHENEDEKKIAIWERLIKVDFEEADMVKELAELREKDENIDDAVDFYKKAIHRYLNKKLFNQVREIWQKLIKYSPQEKDFFLHLVRKVEKVLNTERASQLLEELFEYYKSIQEWDSGIEILKIVLEYDSKNVLARKEITDCYRQKYSYHSQLEEYIKLSNLNQNWRNVQEAISDFEKHISFDDGNFVFHRSWGIGRIKSIQDDEIIIDFAKKRGHTMLLKMAVSALQSLPKDHIWVLRAIKKKEVLKKAVKEDPIWALKTIIKSFDNEASMKQIKAELVPSILTQSEWSNWSTEARKLLKTDPVFGNHPEKMDVYMVRENPISYEEKALNKFKAEKNFFGKIGTLVDFLDHGDTESDYFNEMFSYFVNILKAYTSINEQVISSFLVVDTIIEKFPYLNPGLDLTFTDIIKQSEDILSLFNKIEDTDLKKAFLIKLKNIDNWHEYYIRIFPNFLTKLIVDELFSAGYKDELKDLFYTILDHYRENKEAFLWISKQYEVDKRLQKWDIDYEKILINMIHILDLTYRAISNRREVSVNRKLNKQILSFLFKEERVNHFVDSNDKESINRLYTLIHDVKELDPSVKIDLKNHILEKYPDFKFYGEVASMTVSTSKVASVKGLLATKEKYDEKQKELKHLVEVEIPLNSKEIGAAIELGDLRENAEYKAGKEKQELLQITAAKLKDEIDKATIFDPKNVDPSKISFGTSIVLTNQLTKEKEEYTILGPWESEPSKGIISYLSPFVNEIWNRKIGDELTFTINEQEYHYSIDEITAAKF